MPFFSTVDNFGLKIFLLLSVYVCMICIKAHVSSKMHEKLRGQFCAAGSLLPPLLGF